MLDPQISIQRKMDEDAEYFHAWSQQLWAFDWQQAPASGVDSARVEEDVLSELKTLIWSKL
jgi:hypothetical protein